MFFSTPQPLNAEISALEQKAAALEAQFGGGDDDDDDDGIGTSLSGLDESHRYVCALHKHAMYTTGDNYQYTFILFPSFIFTLNCVSYCRHVIGRGGGQSPPAAQRGEARVRLEAGVHCDGPAGNRRSKQ